MLSQAVGSWGQEKIELGLEKVLCNPMGVEYPGQHSSSRLLWHVWISQDVLYCFDLVHSFDRYCIVILYMQGNERQ